MSNAIRIDQTKVVGFAILIEENGERMLIYSDSVYAGSVTLHQEHGPIMESDDGVRLQNTLTQSYEVRLLGDEITLRKEHRPMRELLLEDSQYQKAIGRLLDAERDPD